VSKKHKHHAAPVTGAALLERVQRAESEGRTQQALDLAKQLHKQEPTPVHLDILKRVYLARAKHLRLQGYQRDAGTVLEAAVAIVGRDDAAWLEKAVEELAAAGHVERALKLLELIPNSPARARVLAQGMDQAVRQGAAGRASVPEALRGQFDRILQAFTRLEAGQDDPARAAVQEIGLQSPFLEWKVMLRGLMAYYQNDDVRALENWQRLAPDRLPARLIAPLRFGIDSAYRIAQEPQAQAALQRQWDRLQDEGLVVHLRSLQSTLANPESLAQAFRLAENILSALRQTQPHLVPRLASCFYWAVVAHGQPEHKNRYRRAFGEPADDPGFARLDALVTEHLGQFQAAHQHWQRFEQAVAANPAAWPGEQANRVRALIWSHMGSNAAIVPNEKKLAQLPAFLRDHPMRPRPLTPNAEECFRRSIELAPDQLEPYEKLFHYYQQEDKPKKAEKAARQLLERFPNHLPTLEGLADLRARGHDHAEAVRLLQKAVQHNPLDRRLRLKLGTAHLFNARTLAEAGRFDDARAEYRTSLALNQENEASVLCKWAACEFKAGDNDRAKELIRQALAKAGTHLATAYSMLIETIRLKLPRTLKARFNQEFTQALAEPPTAVGAVAVAETAGSHRLADVTYFGQKTHEKKVFGYLDRARRTVTFTDEQLEAICTNVLPLGATKLLRAYVQLGQRHFPANPFFPLAEARSYMAQGEDRVQTYFWKVKQLLTEAGRLADELPPDDRHKALREEIQDLQQAMAIFDPFGGMFQNLFDAFRDFGDGGEGEYDEDDDGWGFFDDAWGEDDEFDDEFDEPPIDPFRRPRPRRKKRRRR
jgi:tetratricopeptide (TPR) repeat protein